MIRFAEYSMQDGYLHHWLVAGPLRTRGLTSASRAGYHAIQQEQPVELGQLRVQGQKMTWEAQTCLSDHFLDLTSLFQLQDRCLTAWGYTEIFCPEALTGRLEIAGFGALEFWLNHQLVGQRLVDIPAGLWRTEAAINLQKGRNPLLVRLAACPGSPFPCAVAVRLQPVAPNHKVYLPVSSDLVSERPFLERAFAAGITRQYIYSASQPLVVQWPSDYRDQAQLGLQVRQAPNRVFSLVEGTAAKAGQEIALISSYDVSDGAYQLRLMPRFDQYATQGLRIKRDIPVFFSRNKYHSTPNDPMEKRLADFAQWTYQQVSNPWGHLAQMAVGRWNLVNPENLLPVINSDTLPEDALTQLCLLGMVCRFGEQPGFPEGLKPAILNKVLEWDFAYPIPRHEGEALCQLACELLAGQLFAGTEFLKTHRSGAQHAQRAAQAIRSWLTHCARNGFTDWNSASSAEEMLAGLTLLVDLAQPEDLGELAGVVLDKLLFTLAIQNFQGASGAPRSQASVPLCFGPRFDPLSTLSLLLWGTGVYTMHIAGAVSLLCVSGYSVPEIMNQVALDASPGLWMREAQPCPAGLSRIALYKTPGYMLTSALVPDPGTPGAAEQLWQACLSPDAVVFTSAPTNFSLDAMHQPNFWCGNSAKPALYQWRNTLLAFYRLPADAWLPFTHAYFPESAFDEVDFIGNWAIARCGDAYLGLYAVQGYERVTTGDSAYRELRSFGTGQAWVCRLGSQAEDGSYAQFKENLLQAAITWQDGHLKIAFAGGQTLAGSFAGPLVVNGQRLAQEDPLHYDTPYCRSEINALSMAIRYGEDAIVLNFE